MIIGIDRYRSIFNSVSKTYFLLGNHKNLLDLNEMLISVGDSFESLHKLSKDEISRFAESVGDFNPIHHDTNYASNSKFATIIVSGPQISGLMMAISGTQLSKEYPMLGLSFEIEFKRAVLCNEEFLMKWEVVETSKKSVGTFVRSKITILVDDELCAVAFNSALVYNL